MTISHDIILVIWEKQVVQGLQEKIHKFHFIIVLCSSKGQVELFIQSEKDNNLCMMEFGIGCFISSERIRSP